MHISGSYTFAAPRERVWALLMDTTAIAGCVPGCEELTPLGGDRYRARLAVPVAAITGQFDATIALEDQSPPEGYTLRVDGQGRPGFVKGSARVLLKGDGDRTTIEVAADVQVGGAVARVGQRLLEGVGRTMMNKFFGCMEGKL